MSGHSKWSTIKRKKGAADAKRGKIFSRLAKEIVVAARVGGGDPSANPRLRAVLLAAKANNMPKDNVERAIKKGTGDLEGVSYEETRYECYGPSGVALIVDVLTDNKNRTVSEVRHIITRNGGNMAESGSVAWNFVAKGQVTIARGGMSEEELMDKAIEAGADDVNIDSESCTILTEPGDLHGVAEALSKAGVNVQAVQLTMQPKTQVRVTGKDAEAVLRLMDALDNCDDVQNVFGNFDIPDEEMAALAAEE